MEPLRKLRFLGYAPGVAQRAEELLAEYPDIPRKYAWPGCAARAAKELGLMPDQIFLYALDED